MNCLRSLPLVFVLLVLASCSSAPPKDDGYFSGGELAPPSESTLLMTGRVLGSKGLTNQAELVLGRLIKDHPEYLPGYTELAELLLNEGRIKDASRILGAGLEKFPGNPILLNDLGMCHLLEGDLDSADVSFNAAISASPRDSVYIGNYALVLALQGNDSKAVELWSTILSRKDSLENLKQAQDSVLYRGNRGSGK